MHVYMHDALTLFACITTSSLLMFNFIYIHIWLQGHFDFHNDQCSRSILFHNGGLPNERMWKLCIPIWTAALQYCYTMFKNSKEFKYVLRGLSRVLLHA